MKDPYNTPHRRQMAWERLLKRQAIKLAKSPAIISAPALPMSAFVGPTSFEKFFYPDWASEVLAMREHDSAIKEQIKAFDTKYLSQEAPSSIEPPVADPYAKIAQLQKKLHSFKDWSQQAAKIIHAARSKQPSFHLSKSWDGEGFSALQAESLPTQTQSPIEIVWQGLSHTQAPHLTGGLVDPPNKSLNTQFSKLFFKEIISLIAHSSKEDVTHFWVRCHDFFSNRFNTPLTMTDRTDIDSTYVPRLALLETAMQDPFFCKILVSPSSSPVISARKQKVLHPHGLMLAIQPLISAGIHAPHFFSQQARSLMKHATKHLEWPPAPYYTFHSGEFKEHEISEAIFQRLYVRRESFFTVSTQHTQKHQRWLDLCSEFTEIMKEFRLPISDQFESVWSDPLFPTRAEILPFIHNLQASHQSRHLLNSLKSQPKKKSKKNKEVESVSTTRPIRGLKPRI